MLLLLQVKRLTLPEIAVRLNRTLDAVRNQLNRTGLSSKAFEDCEGGQPSSAGGKITHPEPHITIHTRIYPKNKLGGRG